MKRRTMGCNGGREPSLFEVESRSRGPAEPYRYVCNMIFDSLRKLMRPRKEDPVQKILELVLRPA